MKDTTNMSPEELREYIVELDEENTTLKDEKETLSQNNENLNKELERVRTVNQRFFEKLTAQNVETENKTKDEGEEVPSCEAFARTLNI